MKYKWVVLAVLLVLLSGCYLDSGEADNQMLSFDFISQSAMGYAGDGYYIRASVYEEGDLDGYIDTSGYYTYVDTVNYTVPDPLFRDAVFIGDGEIVRIETSGIITIEGLPARRRVRVLLERYWYYGGVGTYEYAFHLTDIFELESGEVLPLVAVFQS